MLRLACKILIHVITTNVISKHLVMFGWTQWPICICPLNWYWSLWSLTLHFKQRSKSNLREMSILAYFYSRINSVLKKYVGINQTIPVNTGISQIISIPYRKRWLRNLKFVSHILGMPVSNVLFEVKHILCS